MLSAKKHIVQTCRIFNLLSTATDLTDGSCERRTSHFNCEAQSWNGIEWSIAQSCRRPAVSARLRYHDSNSVVFGHRAGVLAKEYLLSKLFSKAELLTFEHQRGLFFLLEACQRNATGWSTADWPANSQSSFINLSILPLKRQAPSLYMLAWISLLQSAFLHQRAHSGPFLYQQAHSSPFLHHANERTQALSCTNERTQALSCTNERTQALSCTSERTQALSCTNERTQALSCTNERTQALSCTNERTQALSCTNERTQALSCTNDRTEAVEYIAYMTSAGAQVTSARWAHVPRAVMIEVSIAKFRGSLGQASAA